MKETIGDNYNVECPHCGKINNYVCQGAHVELGSNIYFKKPCFYCKKEVHYLAAYEIRVKAYLENPFK